MGSFRFALRPRWILSHVLVVVLVVVMVNLGFWQLRRLDEKRDFNSVVRDRGREPTAAIDRLLPASAEEADADAVVYRRVSAVGIYDRDGEVFIRSRSLNDRPGVWVFTPLVLSDGSAVVVNRGFLPAQGVPDDVPAEAEPPEGTVHVEGLLLPGQHRGRFGPKDPEEGTLENLARADLDRLQQQVSYDLYPAYVQLAEQEPQQGSEPELLPSPSLSEGPHLSYALQWFTFSVIALVGYPLILRRQARADRRAG